MKAREIVIAPRVPEFPEVHTGDPFTSAGDVVVDCDVPGCGWHAMGDRLLVKKAITDHNRMHHSDSLGVVLLNQPRQ